MSEMFFSGPAKIDFQGQYVLRFRERYYDCAEYTILGFGEQVVVYDYREDGLKAIDHALVTNDSHSFPSEFNGLAHLTMFDLTDDDPMIIELRDTDQPITHLLWVAIGISGEIPIYEYDMGLVKQLNESSIAILLLLDIVANGIQLKSQPHASSSNPSIPAISRSCLSKSPISKPLPSNSCNTLL